MAIGALVQIQLIWLQWKLICFSEFFEKSTGVDEVAESFEILMHAVPALALLLGEKYGRSVDYFKHDA